MSQLSIYMDFRARPGVPPRAADFEDGITLVRAAERLEFSRVWTTEQHGVDDAKDCGVGCDAETERDDRNKRESRRSLQLTKGKTEIVHSNLGVSPD